VEINVATARAVAACAGDARLTTRSGAAAAVAADH
jgi:hypothetical protein